VGADVFVDAVHLAPHRLMDVEAWQCDFAVFSVYKVFGPHLGMLWGTRERLRALAPYQVRPASDALPDRWMTGTQNHEGIAGALAAVDYLADLGHTVAPGCASRRAALIAAYDAIAAHEQNLAARLLAGIAAIPRLRIWGIRDPARVAERAPTVSITHEHLAPASMAARLAEQGLYAWHGNHYALELCETLGLMPEGTLRIGLLHYNTEEEVERLLSALAALA
jgi:selenocysteine lyase/cysteine desulfurase